MRGEQLNLFDTKYTKIDDLVNESFWAYHAGMADGDGCITTGKERKKEYLRYRLKLCDKNIIEEIIFYDKELKLRKTDNDRA